MTPEPGGGARDAVGGRLGRRSETSRAMNIDVETQIKWTNLFTDLFEYDFFLEVCYTRKRDTELDSPYKTRNGFALVCRRHPSILHYYRVAITCELVSPALH